MSPRKRQSIAEVSYPLYLTEVLKPLISVVGL